MEVGHQPPFNSPLVKGGYRGVACYLPIKAATPPNFNSFVP